MLNRANASSAEFHKKSDSIVQELQKIRNVTSKESSTTTNDVIGLLKLSEYQSNMRMQAESKYGSIKEIEKMAEQTAEIVNLFDNKNTKILKITNVLGDPTKPKRNTPLFYIYDDGTVEKKIIVE